MPKVSIVTPVYNSQTTVMRMIDSIMRQTWHDYELILVDDGSTDSTLSICQRYANQDSRIRVLHQQNRGPSAARNYGIKSISGEFLMCVDADDVLHNDAIEKLLGKMEKTKADVCIFAWNRITKDGSIEPYVFGRDEMVKEKELLFRQIMRGNYRSGGGNPWNKIWRIGAFSETNKLELFDESVQIYEDMLWTLQNLNKVKKIIFEEEQLYDYYILDSSISRSGNSLERMYKFYFGAKRVYQYISEYHSDVESEGKLWYRNRFRRYLKAKRKVSETLTEKEKQDLEVFSILPMKGDKIKDWLAFLFEKIYWR